jgi:cleavage and polyadenylation specificity factor subunit 3
MNITINPSQQQKVDINGEILEIIPLGSGSEVGRSCVIMKFAGKTIMFDCGIHPAYSGIGSLPYFDEIDLSKIDILLITHFHLDHCGALPYFLEKTNFEGECFMTHPTKAIYKLILADYVKVSHVNTEENLYDERDLIKSLDKIKLIDYKQEITTKDIKFLAYNAGHVIGAAMFLIEIQGIRVLYTGDFSREIDRHLQPAEIPKFDVHVLIVESTYGIHHHEKREVREHQFKNFVSEIVQKGGKCLLPVFAVGRAQELLLILDELWEERKELQEVPIYYASSLASNCIDIFKTYINMTGDYVKKKFYNEGINAFNFKHILCVKTIDYLDDNKPAVVFASPGMLQSGLSRNLFEKWCENSNNGIVITGYCVDGTLARYLLGEPEKVQLSDKRIVPLRMSVKNVTFSAHSDFTHTSEFIQKLQPKNIVLVHGDGKEMERLKNELERLKLVSSSSNQAFMPLKKSKIFNPKNCHRIQFFFKIQKNSYVVGQLSDEIIKTILENPLNFRVSTKSIIGDTAVNSDMMDIDQEDEEVENFVVCDGILLEKENLILKKEDLTQYSNIKLNKFKQILSINYSNDKCKEALILLLTDYFREISRRDSKTLAISTDIIIHLQDNQVVLEWFTSPSNDILADSIAMFVYQLQNHPRNELLNHYLDKNSLCQFKLQNLLKYLRVKFSHVEIDDENLITVRSGEQIAKIDYQHRNLESNSEEFKMKIATEMEYFNNL